MDISENSLVFDGTRLTEKSTLDRMVYLLNVTLKADGTKLIEITLSQITELGSVEWHNWTLVP